MKGYQKYLPFPNIEMKEREWPSKVTTKAPVWCSVDLRDGNQALVNPMDLDEKLKMFKMLCEIGFKEIEVGFPSASETEYQILRTLIEDNHIPDDVFVQVLVQSRKHLLEKTFEAIRGAKNVIFHFYNSTSELQRRVVFKTDRKGIIDIAVEGAKIIRENAQECIDGGTNLVFEYSPESFSGTESDFAVEICARVMEELGASPEHRVILNLPNTVELATPNRYADQVEYFCKNLPNRESAIISVHPHNDRGTGVAATELALLAGAERVEGTLFGNGERTGNVDVMNVALNMFTQGVDPRLDFSHVNDVRKIYEECTKMEVSPRHPYAGKLVFTAFSGSHQDAISKGLDALKASGSSYWEVPYLPIDPADVGREYEPIIRINSQSGKGGAAFVLKQYFGMDMPKAMHPEFGRVVKHESDRRGVELSKEDIYALFEKEYLTANRPYELKSCRFTDLAADGGENPVGFKGSVAVNGEEKEISGSGNGPIDAFIKALGQVGVSGCQVVSYDEHALATGSDSKAAAYIGLSCGKKDPVFGVGISPNINVASIKGIISALNREKRAE